MPIRPWRRTASSSAVRRASVEIRQCSTMSSPSNRPEDGVGVPYVDRQQHDPYPLPYSAGRRSRPMSRIGEEWVRAPTAR
ncbi:hypothetical protein SVIOM74S_01343 [Streptomyces violarus]